MFSLLILSLFCFVTIRWVHWMPMHWTIRNLLTTKWLCSTEFPRWSVSLIEDNWNYLTHPLSPQQPQFARVQVGSQTFMELLRRLSIRNNFHFHRDQLQRVETIRLAPYQQEELAEMVSDLPTPSGKWMGKLKMQKSSDYILIMILSLALVMCCVWFSLREACLLCKFYKI